MTRDYTDFINMTGENLARYAYEHANGNELIMALADQLADLDALINQLESANAGLQSDLEDAERRADSWRDEAQAVQRQLDMVRG